MRIATLLVSLSFSAFLGGCGGCYDAFAVDIEVDAADEITECLDVRRGPPLNSCGPTGGVLVDNRCAAPVVFANPEIPLIAAGAVGVVVGFDDADYDDDADLFELPATVGGAKVLVTWTLD